MTSNLNPRDRYRVQIHAEVIAVAWELLSSTTASDVSVTAIATAMRLTPPALYRYIGSREDLLSEVAVRVDEALAAVVCAATPSEPERGAEQLVDIAVALRQWAVTHPHHYLLHASASATSAAPEAIAAEQQALAAIRRCFEPDADRPRPRPRAVKDHEPPNMTPHERAVGFWTRVHGLLGLELTGHLAGLGIEPEAHLRREIRSTHAVA